MLKNNSYTVVFQEKNYITTGGLGGKHSFPDQIIHTPPPPPSKVKRSAPNCYMLLP